MQFVSVVGILLNLGCLLACNLLLFGLFLRPEVLQGSGAYSDYLFLGVGAQGKQSIRLHCVVDKRLVNAVIGFVGIACVAEQVIREE